MYLGEFLAQGATTAAEVLNAFKKYCQKNDKELFQDKKFWELMESDLDCDVNIFVALLTTRLLWK